MKITGNYSTLFRDESKHSADFLIVVNDYLSQIKKDKTFIDCLSFETYFETGDVWMNYTMRKRLLTTITESLGVWFASVATAQHIGSLNKLKTVADVQEYAANLVENFLSEEYDYNEALGLFFFETIDAKITQKSIESSGLLKEIVTNNAKEVLLKILSVR